MTSSRLLKILLGQQRKQVLNSSKHNREMKAATQTLCQNFLLPAFWFLQSSYSQRWSPILEHTGGLSGNVGASHTWPNGATLGGHLHGNLNRRPIIDGFGVRGSTPLGRGWSVGGRVNTRFNHGGRPNIGGGISFIKKFERRRKRSISCPNRCMHSCEIDIQCYRECVTYICQM